MPIDGATASLRPTGVARYFSAVFLGFWLCGWALGEVFGLWFFFTLVRSILAAAVGEPRPIQGGEWLVGSMAAVALLFILFWLTLWTFGGVAALTEFLRSLAGEDRIEAQGTAIEVTRRAGPFRRVKVYDRVNIRAIRLRSKDQALMIDTAASSDVITKFGTADERRQLAAWLQQRVPVAGTTSSATPRGWITRSEGGVTYLTQTDPRTRVIAGGIMWVITALAGAAWLGAMQSGTRSGAVAALLITALLAAAASWVSFSESEWAVRSGELTSHLRFVFWQRERTFRSARLKVVTSLDSDGDRHYKLQVIDGEGEKVILKEMNDDANTTELARWLSSRSGFPLT